MELTFKYLAWKIIAKWANLETNTHTFPLIAILMMDNSVVDLDAIEALYENVSVPSTIHICMVIRCEETTINPCYATEVFTLAAYSLIGMENG